MPPRSKVTKAPSKKKGKALKRVTRPAATDDEWTGEDEPSLKDVVANMGVMLSNLSQKMDNMERRPDAEPEAATTHHLYTTAMPSTSAREDDFGPTMPAFPPSTMEAGVADEVRAQVARRLRSAPALCSYAEEETDTEDDDNAARSKPNKGYRSGKVRTTDSYVTKSVVWPHERCTNAQGQPPVYLDMSLALFTNGYLVVAAAESGPTREHMLEHLQELMEDVEAHGWRVVRDYHAAWLQLLEQGRATWADGPRKEKLRRQLVWNKPALTHRLPTAAPVRPPTTVAPPQPYRNRYGYTIQPAAPGDRSCAAFNRGACINGEAHPMEQHVCSFCLQTARKLCKHSELNCKRKVEAKNGAGGF